MLVHMQTAYFIRLLHLLQTANATVKFAVLLSEIYAIWVFFRDITWHCSKKERNVFGKCSKRVTWQDLFFRSHKFQAVWFGYVVVALFMTVVFVGWHMQGNISFLNHFNSKPLILWDTHQRKGGYYIIFWLTSRDKDRTWWALTFMAHTQRKNSSLSE